MKDFTFEKYKELLQSEKFYLSDVERYNDRDFDKIKKIIDSTYKENDFKTFSFVYDGEPKAAPRPRTTTRGGFVRWYDPGEKDKKAIAKYVRSIVGEDFDPADGEVNIYIKTYKPLIKSFNKAERFLAECGFIRPDKKPDVDNYAKTVMDGINGILWTDDARVVKLEIEKFYSDYPRVEVIIEYRQNRITNK